MMSHLAQLINPIGCEEFFRVYWGRQVLHCRGGAERYSHVLTPAILDEYFQYQQLHPARVKVTKNGYKYPAETWTEPYKTSAQPGPYFLASPTRLFSLYAEGATLVLDVTEDSIPPVARFCESLAGELQLYVQANIYVTPPYEQGFRPHIDDHDVLILQISGSKRWYLYSGTEEPSTTSLTDKRSEHGSLKVNQEIDLEAGDCLYVPCGVIHDARALDDASLHITLGLHTGHWFDLLKDLSSLAEKDPVFRRALPHGLSSDKDKADFAEEFIRQVRLLMAENTASTLDARNRRAAIGNQLHTERARFTDLLKAHSLLPDSMLRRDFNHEFSVERDNGQIRLRTSSDEIRVPGFMESALQVLSRRQPFAVREISGVLSENGKIRLATKLVQAGLLSIESI